MKMFNRLFWISPRHTDITKLKQGQDISQEQARSVVIGKPKECPQSDTKAIQAPAESVQPGAATPADAECILVTYTCGHFQIIQTGGERETRQRTQDTTDEDALNDLRRLETSQHVSCPVSCSAKLCQSPTSQSCLAQRARAAIRDLDQVERDGAEQYLLYGRRYHALCYSAHALLADDPRCALAHEQFALSSIVMDRDPFSQPWTRLVIALEDAEDLLYGKRSLADVQKAFEHINDARAAVGGIVERLHEIRAGIEAMENEVDGTDADEDGDGLPTRQVILSRLTKARWLSRTGQAD